jgi:molybdate transport system ATP-binding protein
MVQNFALFPHLSVAENVAIGGGSRCDASGIRALLSRFGIAHLAERRPEHLSPGEKQRAALARALASDPSLYLLDEPFSALDATTAESLRGELGRFLRGTGDPSVFVTHDRAEAMALADRVAVIDGGAICQFGPAAEVFARPKSVAIARLLGIENILEGRILEDAGDRLGVSVGGVRIDVAKNRIAPAPGRPVTLCVRAENVHLFPPRPEARPNVVRARVSELRRSGPLWTAALDCGGFSLVAYALPQTAEAAALAHGSMVDAEIDPVAIHVLDSTPIGAPAGSHQHEGHAHES